MTNDATTMPNCIVQEKVVQTSGTSQGSRTQSPPVSIVMASQTPVMMERPPDSGECLTRSDRTQPSDPVTAQSSSVPGGVSQYSTLTRACRVADSESVLRVSSTTAEAAARRHADVHVDVLRDGRSASLSESQSEGSLIDDDDDDDDDDGDVIVISSSSSSPDDVYD